MKTIHKKIIRLQANALAKHAKAYVHRTPGPVEDFIQGNGILQARTCEGQTTVTFTGTKAPVIAVIDSMQVQ